jgi:hypothetical protein
MNSNTDDSIATHLAKLPGEPLDPRAAAAVLRRARATLIDEGRPAAQLTRLWTGIVLPAVLLGCAVVYSGGAFQTIQSIYVAGR